MRRSQLLEPDAISLGEKWKGRIPVERVAGFGGVAEDVRQGLGLMLVDVLSQSAAGSPT